MRRHNERFATVRTYRVIRRKRHLESISERHGQEEEEKEGILDHPVSALATELGYCYHNEIRATELIALSLSHQQVSRETQSFSH